VVIYRLYMCCYKLEQMSIVPMKLETTPLLKLPM
jgi:hypothetical protein